MVMRSAPNTFFFWFSRFDRFRLRQTRMPLWWCMPPQNTVGRWLKTAFWRIFLLCHSVRCERERRTWSTKESMSLACFPLFLLFFFSLSFLFLPSSLHSLVLSHNALSTSNKVSQSSFIGIARARATVWCRQTCEVSQNTTYCILSLAFYKRIEYLLLVFVLFFFSFFNLFVWTSCAA